VDAVSAWTEHIHFFFFCFIQQVYMYFRGSGKAAEMKREAARGAMRAAI